MRMKGSFLIAGLVLMTVALTAIGARADMVPIRQGTVVSTTGTDGASYIQVKDDAGKEFWVITSKCIVAEGAKLEVMAGGKYEGIKNESLDKVFDEAYTAQLIRVNGKEIAGFSAHGLPAGCIIIRK